MKTVIVRNIEIGAGIPKIIAPVIGKSEDEIRSQIRSIVRSKADICEWRADAFEGVKDKAIMLSALKMARGELGDMPLLFTVRTASEGGTASVSESEYIEIISAAAQSRLIDLCDVEVLSFRESAAEAIKLCRKCGIPVIASRHHFNATPTDKDMLIEILEMKTAGADIVKLAVMPDNENDVWRLMSMASVVKTKLSCPLVLISMGAIGAKTRAFAEMFGSALTFASAGAASAPGQLSAEATSEALSIVHTALKACNGK